MTPGQFLARLVSLPELQVTYVDGRSQPGWLIISFESISQVRACPHCAGLCESVYDHRWSKCLDSPIRELKVKLKIHKKRYWCSQCRRIFTEPLHGIFKGARLTERLRRNILWCCSRYQSLLAIAKTMGCSDTTVRKSFYAHLRLHFKRHLTTGFQRELGWMSISLE